MVSILNDNHNDSFGSYKVTGNLNTAIDNPNIDVDNVTGINIQNNQYVDSSIINNNISPDNTLVNDNINNGVNNYIENVSNTNVTSNVVSNNSDNSYNYNASDDYDAVYEKKEVSDTSSKKNATKELRLVIFIAFLLLIFILLLPSLFDIFNRLIILITTGR